MRYYELFDDKMGDIELEKYLKYAKMPISTAKPSVMVDGEIIWGLVDLLLPFYVKMKQLMFGI